MLLIGGSCKKRTEMTQSVSAHDLEHVKSVIDRWRSSEEGAVELAACNRSRANSRLNITNTQCCRSPVTSFGDSRKQQPNCLGMLVGEIGSQTDSLPTRLRAACSSGGQKPLGEHVRKRPSAFKAARPNRQAREVMVKKLTPGIKR